MDTIYEGLFVETQHDVYGSVGSTLGRTLRSMETGGCVLC